MDMREKKYAEMKSVSKVKETKKGETSEQRARRYSPFKALFIGGLLATAGIVETTEAHAYQNLAKRYVPSEKQFNEYLEKMNNSSFYFDPPTDAQGISGGETSQSAKKTLLYQREQASIEALKIPNALVREDPKLRKRMLVDTSQDNNQMTSQKDLTQCLGMSKTSITANIEDSNDVPGRELSVNEELFVMNNCFTKSYGTEFDVSHNVMCPPGTTLYSSKDLNFGALAKPSTLEPGQEANADGNPYSFQIQCRRKKCFKELSQAPLAVWASIQAKGYITPDKQDSISSPPFEQLIVGERPKDTADFCVGSPPPSVDCINQCTTKVSNNSSACLDVLTSDVSGQIEPYPDPSVQGQQVRLDFLLSVQNNCPQAIDNIAYQVKVDGGCPFGTSFREGYTLAFRADSDSLAPGDFTGVKAGQNTSMIAHCDTFNTSGQINASYMPSDLSVDVSAFGTDSTNGSQVSSQEKIFTVLGYSPWVQRCDQMCSQPSRASSSRRLGAMQHLLRGLISFAVYPVAEHLLRWRD